MFIYIQRDYVWAPGKVFEWLDNPGDWAIADMIAHWQYLRGPHNQIIKLTQEAEADDQAKENRRHQAYLKEQRVIRTHSKGL